MRIPGFWRIKNKLIDAEMYFLQKRLELNPADHILLCSDPRGGSTWLSEIISQITAKPVLWEPLHLTSTKEFERLGFAWRQHMQEDEKWEEARKTFDDLFRGKILNHWITMYTNKTELLNSTGAVYKFCRANAMIPWLVANFNFNYTPVHLVRHPFAVALSQIKMGWSFSIAKLINQREVHNSYYAPHLDYLKSLKTKEEGLTAFWCLSNKSTLEHRWRDEKWQTIFYEDLLIDPKNELQKLLDMWNLDFDLDSINYTKASSTASKKISFDGEQQVKHWKENLSKGSIQSMQKVLDHFEIDLYSSELYPHK